MAQLIYKLKGFAIILFAACIIFVQTAVVNAEPNTSTASDIPANYEKVSENTNLELYANKTNGEIAVRVKETGYIWRSNPEDWSKDTIAKGDALNLLDSQLALTYSAGTSVKTVNSAASVKSGGLKSEKVQNGIKFSYYFKVADKGYDQDNKLDLPEVGYTIPVQFTLEKDYMKAEILVDKITPKQVTRKEKVYGLLLGQQYYNIIKIDLLPYFGAAGTNDKGYMMIPDGSGALINFNNGKTKYDTYSQPIYGSYLDNPAIAGGNHIKLPVFGEKKGDNAFLAVVNHNESVGFINANISGKTNNYNNVYSSFQYRTIDTASFEDFGMPESPVLADKGNYEVRYYFLSGNKADYSGMANRYQKFLMDEKGLKPVKGAEKQNVCLDIYGGVQKKKSVLGIPTTVFDPLTKYKDLKTITDTLKSKKVDSVVIRYLEWMNNKETGKVPVSAGLDGGLGSKKDFEDFVSYAKSNNIGFYPNVDFVTFSKMGNGFLGLVDAAKTPKQSPAYQMNATNFFTAFGKRSMLLTPSGVVKAFDKYEKSFDKYNNTGISLQALGNIVYSDNSKYGVKRGETPSIWTSIFSKAKKNSQSIMLSNPNAYALPYTDYIVNVPEPELKVNIADEAIPFYQMVIHGVIPYSGSSINLESSTQDSFLLNVETGANLGYTLFKNDGSLVKDSSLNYLYSCDLGTWLDTMAKEYNEIQELNSKVAGKKIVSHVALADGVKETTYENNVKVIVNYNDKSVTMDGNTVNAKGFAVVK